MIKVFVCDDNKEITEFLSIMLQDFGYEAQTCNDYRVVMKMLNEDKPDIIIIDYWLNGVQSDKLILEIKEAEETQDIPIILISAIANLEKVAQTMPIDDFMTKPLDVNEFQIKLSKYTPQPV